MPRITLEEVERVADLAQIYLSEPEALRLTSELDMILEYVQALQDLDTSNVDPASHALQIPTPMRDDVPAPPMDPELVVANAPAHHGSAFVVPKVIEGEDAG